MPRKRRKHSIIDKLPPELKATVEEMMKSDFTYQEIADYIKAQTDKDISITSVWRYASSLNESVETLRMAQENFRVIMEEINKYPALDTSEGIIRLLSHNVLESIQNTPEERWRQLDPEALLKQAIHIEDKTSKYIQSAQTAPVAPAITVNTTPVPDISHLTQEQKDAMLIELMRQSK